jgi:hypothetical protein
METDNKIHNSFNANDNKCDNNNRRITIKAKHVCGQIILYIIVKISQNYQEFHMFISSKKHRDINMFITQTSSSQSQKANGVSCGSQAHPLHKHLDLKIQNLITDVFSLN